MKCATGKTGYSGYEGKIRDFLVVEAIRVLYTTESQSAPTSAFCTTNLHNYLGLHFANACTIISY